MEIINLTQHNVVVRHMAPVFGSADYAEQDLTFAPSGVVARVGTVLTARDDLAARLGIPVARRALGDIQGLPEPTRENGVGSPTIYFIVSTMVLDAAEKSSRSTDDLLVPDSGSDAIRSAPAGIEAALTSLRQNAEWAAQGMPCDPDALAAVLAIVETLAKAAQGQIVAVRRFVTC
jgi:hypothetical protein